MSKARITKNGLLVPVDWMDKAGDEVHVRCNGNTVVIESKTRRSAWKRLLATMVQKLRKVSAIKHNR